MARNENRRSALHVTALDALVNVNSFFTGAVFVGLAFNDNAHDGDPRSLVPHGGCDVGSDVARRLVVFEVISFAFFLLSTLIAHGLKLQLALLSSSATSDALAACPFVHVNKRAIRRGMLATASATLVATVFLTLSIVELVELRLGAIACASRSFWPRVAAFPLVGCSILGVTILITTVLYAFLE